ncbi:fibroblast growth factor-binding protein 1 [Chanos chanos]|uniref:Fibroblast growth factor-binding protein 1 n=1 Tax=Chanos chanos TaxID=29144 RepID=A0A6J2WLA2_CHACN|nr:fibroblast growth factor-binding protein 1-like [Chanos chanos]
MMCIKNVVVVLIVACIAQQLWEVNCQEGKGRKGRNNGKEKGRGRKDNSSPKPSAPSSVRSDSGPKTSSGKGVFKGRFSKDKAQCTWVATGEDVFVLGVNCKKETESFDCEYVAKPNACPQYASKSKTYWKQIARSLKKQKRLCHDATSLVRAGMCRKAPNDAHFKLNVAPSAQVANPQSQSTQSSSKLCPERVDRQRLAAEYCSSSWSSLCTFFFSMIENEDC